MRNNLARSILITACLLAAVTVSAMAAETRSFETNQDVVDQTLEVLITGNEPEIVSFLQIAAIN